MQKVYPIHMP